MMVDWSSISSAIGGLFALQIFLESSSLNQLLPFDLHDLLLRFVRYVLRRYDDHIYFTIEEYDGYWDNDLFEAAQLHLSDIAATSARTVCLTARNNAAAPTTTIADSECVFDTYEGTTVTWTRIPERKASKAGRSCCDESESHTRKLQLIVRKSDREKILGGYIPYIRRDADDIRSRQRQRLLFTNLKGSGSDRFSRKIWKSVPFKNPSTFETLALEPGLKESIVADLVRITESRAFYDRVGRAWKRGYLLYGPPGTGKSSMIAAMANLLEYDIYDLELTQVKSNTQLRSLLAHTTNRSILVIEDIDCSLDITNERKPFSIDEDDDDDDLDSSSSDEDDSPSKKSKSPITLSGMLNFVDGLWSSCGEERIFIFTTNHVDKIDKALLRPGRMDMHIELSYCGFEVFKILARNYLGLEEEHPLFEEVRKAMDDEGVKMTPAEVSEVLTRERDDVTVALTCLVDELRKKKSKEVEDVAIKEEDNSNGKRRKGRRWKMWLRDKER